jgi:hypothetical protein
MNAQIAPALRTALAGGLTLAACVVIWVLKPDGLSLDGARRSLSSSVLADANRHATETKWDDSGEVLSLQVLFRSIRYDQKARFARQLARFLQRSNELLDSGGDENARNLWISQLTPRQTSAALNYLGASGVDAAFGADMQARLIRRLAQSDMSSAIRQVDVIDAGAVRDLALENVAIVQADAGLDAAFNWVNLMPAGQDRDVAAFAIANEAVRSQPTEALRLAADLPAGDATDELIRRAAAEWAMTDQPAATAWAQQLPDEPLRTQVLGAVATAWAESDPGAAAEFASNEMTPGRDQNNALVGVAQRWAQRSPQEAAAWVDGLPAGQLQLAAADSVAAIWAQSAVALARNWRNTIGAGP